MSIIKSRILNLNVKEVVREGGYAIYPPNTEGHTTFKSINISSVISKTYPASGSFRIFHKPGNVDYTRSLCKHLTEEWKNFLKQAGGELKFLTFEGPAGAPVITYQITSTTGVFSTLPDKYGRVTRVNCIYNIATKTLTDMLEKVEPTGSNADLVEALADLNNRSYNYGITTPTIFHCDTCFNNKTIEF